MLVGAVARVYNPGVKFDLVLTLVSTMQGTGKSSFFRALGRSWFSDSFSGVNGKEAFEQLQGAWIMEMAELKGLRKAEVESVKHFIAKQEDIYRPAYARIPETFLRQCVFVATTNEVGFLRDPSGNRRFMPVDVEGTKLLVNPKLMEFIENDKEIAQVWAEAYTLYKKGEKLYLNAEEEVIAEKEQKDHSEVDERSGIIEEYLETKLPEDWKSKDLYERRSFLESPLEQEGTVVRSTVCMVEIWCECLNKDKNDMDSYKTRELHGLLQGINGWERVKTTKRFGEYGIQKYYKRTV
jgi:predicted P-loop ATPase